MRAETLGDCQDIGHGASEAVNAGFTPANAAARLFSGAAAVAGRYLSVPLFGGTMPLRKGGGVPAQGNKPRLRRGFSLVLRAAMPTIAA
jgi:hypothetical protein